MLAGEWRSRDAFVDALQGGEVSKLAGDSEWPIFFKACHLTQSSSRGTLIIKDQEKLSAGIEDKSLVDWVDLKWAFRAHDFERVWVREGDMLTNAIQPGVLMQGAFKQPGHQWEVHGCCACLQKECSNLSAHILDCIFGHALQLDSD